MCFRKRQETLVNLERMYTARFSFPLDLGGCCWFCLRFDTSSREWEIIGWSVQEDSAKNETRNRKFDRDTIEYDVLIVANEFRWRDN